VHGGCSHFGLLQAALQRIGATFSISLPCFCDLMQIHFLTLGQITGHGQRQYHGPSQFICGSFDWVAKTGQCCLNPPAEPVRFLRGDPSFSHFVKVADGDRFSCPGGDSVLRRMQNCPANNTKPLCRDYSGSVGQTVVGHDFLLSTSTHTDGRRAFTLMNFDTTFSAVPTVVIPTGTTNVRILYLNTVP
jgi:hypothetical protein